MPQKIIISGEEFNKALTSIKIVSRGTYRLAIGVFCERDCLKIQSGKLTTAVPGKGDFTGMAVLPLVTLIELMETILPKEQITIERLPSQLKIENVQFDCDWEQPEYEIPDWPYRATLAQIIGLKYRYKQEILDYQNLSVKISLAFQKSHQILIEAACVLQPTGIEFDDLDLLMDGVINRAAKEDKENVIW